MKGEQENKAVFLPDELYSQIEEKIKATSFGSVSEYVVFVLKEVLKEEGSEEEKAFSKEEEEEVKKRLKDWGYEV
jgi:Arc/MetJ-type ribon-helix-helix transcriptional regulator